MQDGKSAGSGLQPVRRSVRTAMLRGFRNRCPNCGEGKLLAGYLMPHKTCPACGAPNGEIKSDDAPPYLTILIVGHIVVPSLLILEQKASLPMWAQFAIWLPVTLVLMFTLLPRIKGAWMGFMWALRMKGSGQQ